MGSGSRAWRPVPASPSVDDDAPIDALDAGVIALARLYDELAVERIEPLPGADAAPLWPLPEDC